MTTPCQHHHVIQSPDGHARCQWCSWEPPEHAQRLVAEQQERHPPSWSFSPGRVIVRGRSLGGRPVVGRYDGPAHRKDLPITTDAPRPWIWVQTEQGRGFFLAEGWEAL